MKNFLSFLFLASLAGAAIFFIHSKQSSSASTVEEPQTAGVSQAGTGPAAPVEAVKTENPSAHLPPTEDSVSSEDLHKVVVLKEILESKNDNDPRLDSEFKSLTPGAKKVLRQEYKGLKPERFNEKGTVVFILGKNLANKEDFDFFADVLSEPPCQNLADCSASAADVPPEAAHEESADQVTLSYPQIVSLKALDHFLAAHSTLPPDMTKWTQHDLNLAAGSGNPVVAAMAQEIIIKYDSLAH